MSSLFLNYECLQIRNNLFFLFIPLEFASVCYIVGVLSSLVEWMSKRNLVGYKSQMLSLSDVCDCNVGQHRLHTKWR